MLPGVQQRPGGCDALGPQIADNIVPQIADFDSHGNSGEETKTIKESAKILGLPGLNGFVGEFLVLLGAFQAEPLWAVVAGLGVILAAVYMLWMFQRVMFGEVDKEENRTLKDLNLREAGILLVMVFFIIQFGVYPKPYIDRIQPSIKTVLKRVEERTAHMNAGTNAFLKKVSFVKPGTLWSDPQHPVTLPKGR